METLQESTLKNVDLISTTYTDTLQLPRKIYIVLQERFTGLFGLGADEKESKENLCLAYRNCPPPMRYMGSPACHWTNSESGAIKNQKITDDDWCAQVMESKPAFIGRGDDVIAENCFSAAWIQNIFKRNKFNGTDYGPKDQPYFKCVLQARQLREESLKKVLKTRSMERLKRGRIMKAYGERLTEKRLSKTDSYFQPAAVYQGKDYDGNGKLSRPEAEKYFLGGVDGKRLVLKSAVSDKENISKDPRTGELKKKKSEPKLIGIDGNGRLSDWEISQGFFILDGKLYQDESRKAVIKKGNSAITQADVFDNGKTNDNS